MRFARLRPDRRTLQFERLEDRLALSITLGSLDASASTLSAMKKPVGAPHPIGISPAQIRTAYGFDNITFNGAAADGAGQTIAIVDAKNDPYIVNDLAVFDDTFGLPDPPSFTVVNQSGGTKLPKNSRNWAEETALDVEWAHAIAPGANILLVEAKSASTLGDAIDYARHVPGVTVVSVSVGGKEFKSEQDADDLFTTPAGHVGETFVFSAGDEGGKAEYPSSSPNVLSVGGTSLDISFAGNYLGETVWADGGGGLSKYEGVPSYQNGLGLTARGTPDVSYDGDPETGFAVFDTYGTGGWGQYGGTSVGTPQWAALLAIANQGRVAAGKEPLANAQAALYALPSADFHDIVSGSNGQNAAAGYDLASGLGSPIADKLIPDLVAFTGSTDFTVAGVVSAKVGNSSNHFTFNVNSVGASLGPLSLVSVTSSVRNLTASYEANILPLVSAVVAPTNLDTGLAKQSSAKSQLKLAKHGGKLTSKLAGSSFGVVDAYFADLGGRVAAA
jgi:subtilase family serine protease